MKAYLFRKRGWSDTLYWMNLKFAWYYTYVCVILSCIGGFIGIADYSFVSIGLPIVWGEVSVHSAAIVWKTKAENVAKIGQKDNIIM